MEQKAIIAKVFYRITNVHKKIDFVVSLLKEDGDVIITIYNIDIYPKKICSAQNRTLYHRFNSKQGSYKNLAAKWVKLI